MKQIKFKYGSLLFDPETRMLYYRRKDDDDLTHEWVGRMTDSALNRLKGFVLKMEDR